MWEQSKKHPGDRPGVKDYIRIMRTMGGNVEDAESIGQAYDVLNAAEVFIGEAVGRMRVEGFSWEEIAAGAKMTRQGARKKWLVYERAAKLAAKEGNDA